MARTHKSILSEVMATFQDAEAARSGLEQQWLHNLNMVKRIDKELKRRAELNRSSIYIPAAYWTLWSMAPKVVLSLLSQKPYVLVLPRPGTTYEKAAAMQYLLNAQLIDRRVNIRRKALEYLLTLGIYGFGATYVGWRKEYRTRRFRMEDGTVERRNVLSADIPEVTVFDAFSTYVDPYATSQADMEFVIIRRMVTTQWLRRMAKRNKDDIFRPFRIPREFSDTDGHTPPEWWSQKKELEGWATGGLGTGRFRRHELIQMWTRDGVTSVLNREWVIQHETENPFWHGELPFIIGGYDQLPGEIVGDSLVGAIADLQHLLNAQVNQRLDNVNMIINKMWKVLRGAEIDEEELRTRPYGIVHVDSHDDIQEIQFSDVTSSAYVEEEHTLQNIERASGVYRHTMGQPLSKRQTATEAVSLQANADERVELRVGLLSDEWFGPLVQMMADNNQQFISPGTVIKIMGPHGLPVLMDIDPADIEGEFEFEYRGASVDDVASRNQKVNQMITMLPILQNLAQEGQVQVDLTAYLRRILELAQVGDLGMIFPSMTTALPAEGAGEANAPPESVVPLGAPPADLTNLAPGIGAAPEPTPFGTPTMRIGPTPREVGPPGTPI